MKRTKSILAILACLILGVGIKAAEFTLYQGAKIDENATQEAMEAAKAANMTYIKSAIYTTQDSFQKVTSFYKAIAREYMMPRASGTSGSPKKYGTYDLYEAYFIFDNAQNLASSRLWIKVQRPYIGENVRDITAIVVTEKK